MDELPWNSQVDDPIGNGAAPAVRVHGCVGREGGVGEASDRVQYDAATQDLRHQGGLLGLKLEDCRGVDSYVSKIDEKVSAYNLCADSTATGGDVSGAIPKKSRQEHVFYLLRGVPRKDDWNGFLEILGSKPDRHVKPDEVVTQLMVQEAAIEREMGMSTERQLFAKSGRESQARKHQKGRGKEKDTESDSDSSHEKRARRPEDSREYYECHDIRPIARFGRRKSSAGAAALRRKRRKPRPCDYSDHYWTANSGPV